MNSDIQRLKKITKFLKESYGYDINLKAISKDKAKEMMKRTSSKITKLKESNSSQREIDRLTLVLESLKLWTESPIQTVLTKPVTEGLDDSDVEEAKVILAAQELSDQLQKMVETIAQMQVQDLMPIVDAMKADIGTTEAETFSSSVDSVLSELLDAAKSAKDGVTNAILAAQGQAPTDMDSEMGGDMDMDMDMDSEMSGDMDSEMGDEFGGDDAMAGPEDEPLGREMKESSKSTKKDSLDVFEAMLKDIQENANDGKVTVRDLKSALAKFRS